MTSTITLFIFSRWTRGYIKIIYDKCMEGDKIECFHPRPFAFKSSPLSLSTKKKKKKQFIIASIQHLCGPQHSIYPLAANSGKTYMHFLIEYLDIICLLLFFLESLIFPFSLSIFLSLRKKKKKKEKKKRQSLHPLLKINQCYRKKKKKKSSSTSLERRIKNK